MKTNYHTQKLFTTFLLLSIQNAVAQNVQVLSENFETPNSYAFSLNTPGPSGSSGVNRWIINNEFNGLGVYPNTMSQDSTNGGQIYLAPYSHYLHIYDSANGASQNVFNCNYDATQPSDNFTEMTSTVCTRGMTAVTLAFFYTCTGSPSAYGTLWYSANGGPWTQTGASQYNTMNRWQYVAVANPAFDNVANLKFGFRWQNTAGTPPSATAFGIDDIQIVGTFNASNISLNIDSVWPNPICPNRYVFVEWSLSAPLCNATYMYELSNGIGSFSNPTTLGVVNINNGQVNGINAVFIPAAVLLDTCYKIRLRRLYPAPLFTGNASSCFVVQNCANTLTISGPPAAAMDTNAVCAGSVMDVNFYSTGTFILNTYKLQLSDMNGNFIHPDSANARIIGTLPPPYGNITFDSLNPIPGYPPPGLIEGRIPDTVSSGCNYRLRVIATSPAVGPAPLIGTSWGPFCIQHCDIMTNNGQDINFCLYPDTSICVPLVIGTHFYNNNAVYPTGNQFMLQLLSRGPNPPPFTQVGILGALGTYAATADTIVQLCISYNSLISNGISPGKYYMRIVATNSSLGPDSSFGSLIRISIGAPSIVPLTIQAVDCNTMQPVDTICSGDLVYFYITPSANSNSTYYWYSIQLQGSPVVHDSLFVNFANFSGNFTVYVKENSFGCFGPASQAITIYVTPLPNVGISQPAVACIGDTIQYTVPFAANTYWTWWLSTGIGTIVDTTNNQVQLVFNSAGVDTLWCQALNTCGMRLGFRKVVAYASPPVPTLIQSGDTLICSISSGFSYRWYRNGILQTQYTTQSIVITSAENGNWHVEVRNTNYPYCSSASAGIQTTVSVSEAQSIRSFSVIPNPVANELFIIGFLTGTSVKAEITIYNTLGEKILSKEIAAGENEIKLNVKNLAAGIYVVRINAEKLHWAGKFVKE
jgi:hypothetical protein